MKDNTVSSILNNCLNGKADVTAEKSKNSATIEKQTNTRLYGRRWIMLGMHFFYTLIVSLQFAQFVIISNLITKYYNVPDYLVDYTTMSFMVMYIPLIIPALQVFDLIGIKNFLLLSTIGICLGTWIKVYGSLETNRFIYILIGQSLVAAFQILSFGLAPRISAVWFGPNEVSTACSIAFFGDQLGSLLSFALPGLMVQDSQKLDVIGSGITNMNVLVAVVTTILCLSIALFFEEAPPLPPSSARMLQKLQVRKSAMKRELVQMLSNWENIRMMIAYGMSVGVFNAFVILLNDMFLKNYPNQGHHVGVIGAVVMILGIIGSLSGGHFLDKTHLFKETAVFYYGLSCVFILMYSLSLKSQQVILVYLSTALFGFSIMGYYSVGVQICIEATYPISECISSSVLLFCVHVFGILFTFTYRNMYKVLGDFESNLAMTAILLVGTILTATTPIKQCRQKAESSGATIVSHIVINNTSVQQP